MPLTYTHKRSLVWNNVKEKMVSCYEIGLELIGNKGTVMQEFGPLYIENLSEYSEACDVLYRRFLVTNELLHFIGQDNFMDVDTNANVPDNSTKSLG